MKACKHCFHYVHLGDGKNGKGEATAVGNCFRYPPVVRENGSSYPIVGSNERQCGEFKLSTQRKSK